jgi:hypothetical protein
MKIDIYSATHECREWTSFWLSELMKRWKGKLFTNLSLSRDHLDWILLLLMANSVEFPADSSALIRWLFLVPGGPYKRMNLCGSRFPRKSCGNFVGSPAAIWSSIFVLAKPAILPYVMSGFLVTIVLSRDSLSCLSRDPRLYLSSICFSWENLSSVSCSEEEAGADPVLRAK